MRHHKQLAAPCLTAALCLCAGTGAFAEEPRTSGSVVSGTGEPARLPTGDSEAFRRRMTSWTAAVAPSPIVTRSSRSEAAGPRLYVSSPFGWRSDPIQGVRRRHAGVDLPGPSGARIFATGPGVVSFAGWSSGYGKMVQIDHADGVRTRFGHLSSIAVSAGAPVGQGDLIGFMGSTGRSTGTHLHYEVRVNGVPVNPLAYIGQTMQSYETLWAPERTVTPRWAGWAANAATEGLPIARIQ